MPFGTKLQLYWRVLTSQAKQATQICHAFAIQMELFHRRAANRRNADNSSVIVTPGEMFGPAMLTWIVEWHGFTGHGVRRMRACVFPVVAPLARQGQIEFCRSAAAERGTMCSMENGSVEKRAGQ